MSTFDGVITEFPDVRIDNFLVTSVEPSPLAYFLSHVHTDHTQGLETYRSPAFIYCSAATKALLLRMEKYPSRVNFDRGYLEAKKQHFRHLRSVLRPLPLNTPCEVQLTPQKRIRVTLFDANHCPGAVMFLVEGGGKNVLYTGDIRAEQWWIEALMREPAMVAYVAGLKTLDRIYLDTTYAAADPAYRIFPTKASGLQHLIRQIASYSEDTVFHLKAWTLGYEEAFMAIASAFSVRLHVDRYKAELYRALEDVQESVPHAESASLNGFNIGSLRHAGVLSLENSRFHICDPYCEELLAPGVVRIIPVVSAAVQEPAAPVRFLKPTGGSEDLVMAPNQIVYAFSRHSSYEELRSFVRAFRPRDIHPNVYPEDDWCAEKSIEALFGDLCSGPVREFDERCKDRHYAAAERAGTVSQLHETQVSERSQLHPSSPISPESAPDALPPVSDESPIFSAFDPPVKRRKLATTSLEWRVSAPYVRVSVAPLNQEAPIDSHRKDLGGDEGVESQLTLPDSAFASQNSELSQRRLEARKVAYRAAREGGGAAWAELSLLPVSHVHHDVEL